MNLTIEIPDSVGTLLKAQAQAQGITPARYASRVIEKIVGQEMDQATFDKPFETGYGPKSFT
jgi:hypothetical protein